MRFVDKTLGYIEPGDATVARYSEKIKASNIPTELAKDISNLFNAQMKGQDFSFIEHGDDFIEKTMDKMEIPVAKREQTFNEMKEQLNGAKEFLSGLDYSKFSGRSPLEKSINCIAAMQGQGLHKPSGGGTSNYFGIDVGPTGKGAVKTFQKNVENTKKVMGDISDEKKELLGIDKNMTPESAAEILKSKKNILKNISAVKKGGNITAKKIEKVTVDPEGEIERYMPMEDVIDTTLLSPTELVDPEFDRRIVEKDYYVKKNVNVESNKQSLVLLIDDSGSMSCQNKVEWVEAILIDRVAAVAKGDAELFVALFDENRVYEMKQITTLEQGKQYIDNYNPRGGDTYVQECAEHVIDQLLNKQFGNDIKIKDVERPQLVIVNDGQDPVCSSWKPSIETHAFILGTQNENLRKAVVRSGGTYNRFL